MPSIVTYSAAESGLLVNSYLVDTGDGIAVVDTGLLRSDAHALRSRLDALRAPLRAVLLTHPHPDHVNGTAELWHRQRRYLLMAREAVRGRAGDGALTDADRTALVATMVRFAPDAPLPWLVGLGADAVARELTA